MALQDPRLFILSETDITVDHGEVVVECRTTDHPRPVILWACQESRSEALKKCSVTLPNAPVLFFYPTPDALVISSTADVAMLNRDILGNLQKECFAHGDLQKACNLLEDLSWCWRFLARPSDKWSLPAAVWANLDKAYITELDCTEKELAVNNAKIETTLKQLAGHIVQSKAPVTIVVGIVSDPEDLGATKFRWWSATLPGTLDLTQPPSALDYIVNWNVDNPSLVMRLLPNV